MEKAEFIKKVFTTPCEQCPIDLYCECSKAQACHIVASDYYDTVISWKGVFVCPTKETE